MESRSRYTILLDIDNGLGLHNAQRIEMVRLNRIIIEK